MIFIELLTDIDFDYSDVKKLIENNEFNFENFSINHYIIK